MLDIKTYRGKTRAAALGLAKIKHGNNFTILTEREVSQKSLVGMVTGKKEHEVRIMLQSASYEILKNAERDKDNAAQKELRSPEITKHKPINGEEIGKRILQINKNIKAAQRRTADDDAAARERQQNIDDEMEVLPPPRVRPEASSSGESERVNALEKKIDMLMGLIAQQRTQSSAQPAPAAEEARFEEDESDETEEPLPPPVTPRRREPRTAKSTDDDTTLFRKNMRILNDNTAPAAAAPSRTPKDDTYTDEPLFRAPMPKQQSVPAAPAAEVFFTRAEAAPKRSAAFESAGGDDVIAKHLSLLRRRDFPEDAIDELREYLYHQSDARFYQDNNTVKTAIENYFDKNLFLANGIPLTQRKKIIMLVGPTGVGKTTTIPKLASLFRNVRQEMKFITLDCYRIAAEEQLRRYAEIMKVPFAMCKNPESFREEVLSFKGSGLIFVDSIGRSPKNTEEIMQVGKFLKNTARIDLDVQLVISATTKYYDALDIIDNFKMLNYSGAIITKLDETSYIGAALSAVIKNRLSLSYLCFGQSVPRDVIEAAKGKQHIIERIYGE
ncbi:MAG: AAA family ATPase [Spirochaetes bacterium]|nr:AAA family ATPase [Spirochaetota bacterium]